MQDIENQFIRVGRSGESPWVLGIGNKDTDAQAYQMCNIRLENIFIVQVGVGEREGQQQIKKTDACA
jgi:phosphatidate phosphatase PAH1